MLERVTRNLLGALSAILLLLAAGFTYATVALREAAERQLDGMRTAETQISEVERLRADSEAVAAASRGYLLTGSQDLHERLFEKQESFDARLARLAAMRPEPEERSLLDEIKEAAKVTKELQLAPHEDLRGTGSSDLVERFESDLLPARQRLERALSAYGEHTDDALSVSYAARENDRQIVYRRTAVLVGAALIVCLGLTAWLSIAHDRVRAREREALAHAERAVRGRDELMSVVAHDLRSPLAAIAMKGALIHKADDLEKARAQGASVEQVAMRMEYLIKGLLDLGSLEAGRFQLHPTRCNVRALFDECVSLFGGLAASKGITLDAEAARDLVLVADEQRLLQVLSNVIGNAVKFTPRDGVVRVRAWAHDGAVRFEVRDSGPGIGEEDRGHVFERFWRSNTTESRGTGLGLFISKTIVTAHGGRIWIGAPADGGTAVTFDVPNGSPRSSEAAFAPAAAAPA